MSAEAQIDPFDDETFDESIELLRIPAEDGIILQKLREDDADLMLEAINYDRAHLLQFDDDTADKYKTVQDIINSILNPNDPTRLRLGIWDGDTFMGSINLQPRQEGVAEVGYWLGAKYTGHGVTAKAVRALSKYAFDNGYDTLFAKVFASDPQYESEGNKASKRTLLNSGFHFTKLIKEEDDKGNINWYWRFEKSNTTQNT